MREFYFASLHDPNTHARRAERRREGLNREPYAPSAKALRYEQRADDEGRALAEQHGYLL
jgi:hypothetical protein